MSGIIKLIISIVICFLPGLIGSIITYESVNTWYTTINKPDFNPPDYVFAPVWTALYFLMGISLFLIWKEGLSNKIVKSAFIVFLVQLVFNALWTVIFFGLHSIAGGLIVILILWILILVCIIRFKKISVTASYLLIPYFIWVTFATILNFFILLLN